MPRWVRSLVPPLFGGLLGGAITFVVLSIATITYLGVLHKFQTLLIGILAIVASLIALFGVHMQSLNVRGSKRIDLSATHLHLRPLFSCRQKNFNRKSL